MDAQELDGSDDEAGPGLPAAEVRRRGDRRRRRRAALAGGASALALATVVVGGTVVTDALRADAPSRPQPANPAPTPSATPSPLPTPSPVTAARATRVPDGFPLAAGYPTPPADAVEQQLVGPGRRVTAFEDLGACGTKLHPTAEPADRLAVTFSQPEDFRARELTTYPDDAIAQGALARLVDAYRACPRQSYGGTPESVTLTDVRTTSLGEEGYVVVNTYEVGGDPAIGLGQIQLVRVGNALLISTTADEGSSESDAVDREVRGHTAAIRPVVEAMCVFGPSPC